MMKFRLSATLALAGLLAAAAPSVAQKVDSAGSSANSSGRPDTRVVYGTDPGTTNLNQQQAVRAAQMDHNNVQNAEIYRRQVEEHNRAVAAAEEARRAYEADLARNNAQTAAYQAQRAAYEAAMVRWREDVAACNAGNRSRCGTVQPR